MGLNLFAELVEIVSKLSPLHDFITKLGSVFNGDDVLGGSYPLLESLSQHYSIDHVSDPLKLVDLSIGRSNCHGLLSLLLRFKSV